MNILGRLVVFLSSLFRRAAAMLVDALIILESLLVALLFRFDGSVPQEFWGSFWPFAAVSVGAFLALLIGSGMYRDVRRYTGVNGGVRTTVATALAAVLLLAADYAAGVLWPPLRPAPLSVVAVGCILAYVQLVAVRLYPRVFYERSLRDVRHREHALIVGAGEAGAALARQLWRTPDANLRPAGFVDEDATLRGGHIEGVPILGGLGDIGRVVEERGIDQILVALSAASPDDMDRVWRECAGTGVRVRIVPRLAEILVREEAQVPLREIRIDDLLGRQPIGADLDALTEFVNGRKVLVTGAGGSIGRELSRQISRLGPTHLVLLDRDESALFNLGEDLVREGFTRAELVIGDVTNARRMRTLFEHARPQLVFHAAAYKHVPLMERYASEAVLNNVGGTLTAAQVAGEFGVERFVNVSTDKAVNPANTMGATKRIAEGISRAMADEYPETLYVSVRFGNVLGSRGSVVPTFKRQIQAGGPVTVTHPEMTRYFMTIPEAVSLVLQASAVAADFSSYGAYLLEMGRPVRIVDLARKMIELMGAKGVETRFVGLRPGERLHEELFEEDERRVETSHPKVFRLVPETSTPPYLLDEAEEMIHHAHLGDDDEVLKLLRRAVPDCPFVNSARP